MSNSEAGEHRPSNAPLIFISHDTRDAGLAEAFSRLLSSVSAGVLKSFRSSDRKGSEGIEYGVEWYPELMSKLASASDIVCLLTSRSLDRPWLLYEAGVAKGKLSSPVYGVALGIPLSRANTGPFAQFQNSDDNEESLTKLVMQLVRRIPGSEPDHDAILMQVRTFKEKVALVLESLVGTDAEDSSETLGSDNSVVKMFEEVKVMFQDLPSRITRVTERSSRIRRKHYHPMMIHELASMIMDQPDDPNGILVVLSFLREDYPWLYELGLEVHRAIKSKDYKAIESATAGFQRAAQFTLRGPFREEMGMDKEMHMLLHDLPMLFDDLTQRCLAYMRPSISQSKPSLPEADSTDAIDPEP